MILNTRLTTNAITRTTINLIQQFIITPIANTLSLFNRGLSGNAVLNAIITRTKTVITSITENLNILNIVNRLGLFSRGLIQNLVINPVLRTGAAVQNIVNIIQQFIITPIANTLSFFNRGLSGNVIIDAIVTRTKTVITSLTQPINLIANLIRNLFGFRTLTGNIAITTVAGRSFGITTNIFQLIDLDGIANRVYTVVRNPVAVLDIDNIFEKKSFFFRLIEALLRIIGIGRGPAEPEPEPTPTPTPTPTPSGGAGGSGGSGGSGSVVTGPDAVPNIILEPPELSIFVVSGVEEIRKIKIVNLDRRSIVLNVEIAGKGLEDVLSLDKSITLKPGEEKLIDLKINAKNTGLLTGKIIFKSGNYANEVLIVINARSENFLFDISIDILDEFKILGSGEKLLAQISLLQIGPLERVDVTANYVIKDFFGDVYLEGSETFYVAGQKEYVKEFSTLDLPPGKYIVGLEIIYPGDFATSSSQFEIKKKATNRGLFIIIFAGIVLIIILASIFILFMRINLAKKRRLILNLIKEKYKIKGKVY